MENYGDSIRKRIMKLLEESKEPLTAEQIITLLNLDLSPQDIYRHLEHIAKTVRRVSKSRKILVMRPPMCRKCGYIFKDLKKPRKPSKCPRCHSEWIEPPAFKIIER